MSVTGVRASQRKGIWPFELFLKLLCESQNIIWGLETQRCRATKNKIALDSGVVRVVSICYLWPWALLGAAPSGTPRPP